MKKLENSLEERRDECERSMIEAASGSDARLDFIDMARMSGHKIWSKGQRNVFTKLNVNG